MPWRYARLGCEVIYKALLNELMYTVLAYSNQGLTICLVWEPYGSLEWNYNDNVFPSNFNWSGVEKR